MENLKDTYQNSENADNANATSHYVLMTIGIAIGFLGVILRFVIDWEYIDLVANIIFIIGTVVSLKAIVDILK